ncbi:MAG: RHS repeat domain-containing protein, partial [Planctomycetales bacterium]
GYDAVGNVTSQTDRNGRLTNFTYDTLYRLTSELWKSGGSTIRTTRACGRSGGLARRGALAVTAALLICIGHSGSHIASVVAFAERERGFRI